MRRRRRTRYTWFPQLGEVGEGGQANSTAGARIQFSWDASGDPGDVTIFPVLPDAVDEEPTDDTNDQLQNFLKQEYVLKRIVGKLHIALEPRAFDPSTLISTHCIVGAGFFVSRASGGGNDAQPIEGSTSTDRRLNYGPLNLSTTREPWIWRRTWALSIPNVSTSFASATSKVGDILAIGRFPNHNYGGSVADGPHIDAKVARRVGQDDRLFFAIQAIATDFAGTGTPVNYTDTAYIDCRYLGATRKAKQRSAF